MKRYLIHEMKRYLALVPDASEGEISELKKWEAAENTLILGTLRMNAEQSCRSSKPDVKFSFFRKNLIKTLA